MSRLLLTATWVVLVLASSASPARAEDQARGGELFQLCLQCHGEQGEGNPLALAPAIAGLADWYVERQLHNFKAGVRGTHPDDVGGLRMYPMSRAVKSDEDIRTLAAYVASLPAVNPDPVLEGGDAERGQALYATCGACHGPDGAGIQVMNAPALTGTHDWYLLSALEKYKLGIRGGSPKDPNGALMRGMAMQLASEQQMKDVIAYIVSLSK
jgi:cytochrome c553